MPDIEVTNTKREKVETLNLEDSVFGITPHEGVVHEAVKMQLACERQGSASTKTRGEISASNRKPWRQKGTGRARAGRTSSPIWKGGGVVFGPRPRSYAYSIPKKKRVLALKSLLSSKVADSAFVVIDKFGLESPKTKDMATMLNDLNLTGKVLVIGDISDVNLCLAGRNIPNIKLVSVSEVNTYDLISADNVLVTKDELTVLTERFQ